MGRRICSGGDFFRGCPTSGKEANPRINKSIDQICIAHPTKYVKGVLGNAQYKRESVQSKNSKSKIKADDIERES